MSMTSLIESTYSTLIPIFLSMYSKRVDGKAQYIVHYFDITSI